jgi:hypothetical protein
MGRDMFEAFRGGGWDINAGFGSIPGQIPGSNLVAVGAPYPLLVWIIDGMLHVVTGILSFTLWLVVGVHRQSHRSSIVDPMNVTPRTHFVRIPCVVNAKCDTRSANCRFISTPARRECDGSPQPTTM